MQANEFINSLFVAAAVLGVIGVILMVLSNLIFKAMGSDIHQLARESDHVRELSMLDQLRVFFSDLRRIPAFIGIFGMFLCFGAVCMGIGALVWYVIKALS